MSEPNNSYADVLIVCGQGTYADGCFYSEYPDRDVYVGHATEVARLVDRYGYSHVAASGGYTQSATPWLSEAESFLGVWDDTESNPVSDSQLILDIHALDSAENVYLGLVAARSHLKLTPIRRIGVSCAWQFKKRRIVEIARALGIEDRTYFHGYAPAGRALAGEEAQRGEEALLAKLAEDGDVLLLEEHWERRRYARYFGGDYLERIADLVPLFPAFFKAMLNVRLWGMEPRLVTELQQAFQDDVVRPYQGD